MMPKLSSHRVLIILAVGVAIFMLSGMMDFSIGLESNGKSAMYNPIISAFSPVALMLYLFGFVGLWFLITGVKNFKVQNKLAKRQLDLGFIILLSIYLGFELLLRVPQLL